MLENDETLVVAEELTTVQQWFNKYLLLVLIPTLLVLCCCCLKIGEEDAKVSDKCLCSVPIENLVRFRNRSPRSRTGCPVLEPENDFSTLGVAYSEVGTRA